MRSISVHLSCKIPQNQSIDGCILLQHPSSQTKHKALLHYVIIIIIMIHHVPDIQGVGIVQLFILCLKTKDSLNFRLKLYLYPCYKVWAAPC